MTLPITLTREELYKRVWSTPMRTLAIEFGVSDIDLVKICKNHEIPRPPVGYWTKVAYGKELEQEPLDPVADESLQVVCICEQKALHALTTKKPSVDGPQNGRDVSQKEQACCLQSDPVDHSKDQGTIPFSLVLERQVMSLIALERKPENRILPMIDLRGAHPLIVATKKSLLESKADQYGRVHSCFGCFDVRVYKDNVHRTLLILHTLVQAFKTRSYTVNNADDSTKQPWITILDKKFRVSVQEKLKQHRNPVPREKMKTKDPWGYHFYKPYKLVPSGILELHLDRNEYGSTAVFYDNENRTLEERLNEFIVRMLKVVVKSVKEDEERLLKAAEAKRMKQVAVTKEMIAREHSIREKNLKALIPQWEEASRIRNFIDAVRLEALRRLGMIDDSSEAGRWLIWAEEYLNSLDPLAGDRALPAFSLTDVELEQLKKECESDWCSYSQTFRKKRSL